MQGAPSLSYSSFHRLCSNYVTVSNNLPHPVAREPGSFKDTIEPRPPPPHGRKKSTQNPEPEICFITFPQSSMQFPELATTKTGHSFSSGALELQAGRGFVHCYRSCRVGRGNNPNKTMCNSETLRIDTQASHKLQNAEENRKAGRAKTNTSLTLTLSRYS